MALPDAPSRVPEQRVTTAPAWRPRSDVDLAEQQLRAIERFNRTRRMREQAAAAAAPSQEMRLDAARSMQVLRRQHEAVVARAHEQLIESGQLLQRTAQRRVVLAHRDDAFLSTLAGTLEEQCVRVVRSTDNGADAVGVIVAEQPDLVLIEDKLRMIPGLQVIREVRRFSPLTLVTAQVAYGHRVGPLRSAGATTVFAHDVPAGEVARTLLVLVSAA